MDVKPTPKVVSEVCSLCGLDWKRHGKAPTAEKCIGLLLEEVRSLNAQLAHRPLVRPIAYPTPAPWVSRPIPWWSSSPPFVYGSGTAGIAPQTATATPRAIAR